MYKQIHICTASTCSAFRFLDARIRTLHAHLNILKHAHLNIFIYVCVHKSRYKKVGEQQILKVKSITFRVKGDARNLRLFSISAVNERFIFTFTFVSLHHCIFTSFEVCVQYILFSKDP